MPVSVKKRYCTMLQLLILYYLPAEMSSITKCFRCNKMEMYATVFDNGLTVRHRKFPFIFAEKKRIVFE